MAVDAIKSQSITNLDSTPYVYNSAGQGAAARAASVDDLVGITTNGLASTGSTYRVVRFPTGAIPKDLTVFIDSYLDSHSTPAVVMDLNIAFSDSTIDGTQASLQGLIPSSLNTGATSITNITSYSNPNLIFGQITPTSATGSYGPTSLIFNGSKTNYPVLALTQQPLWQTFGFVDGRGNPADPGGYFDLLIYISTAASTAHAANLYAKFSYAKN
jgi:hypothetical protein